MKATTMKAHIRLSLFSPFRRMKPTISKADAILKKVDDDGSCDSSIDTFSKL